MTDAFADPGPPGMGGHPIDADRGGDENERAALAAEGGALQFRVRGWPAASGGHPASRLHEPHVLRLVILIGLPHRGRVTRIPTSSMSLPPGISARETRRYPAAGLAAAKRLEGLQPVPEPPAPAPAPSNRTPSRELRGGRRVCPGRGEPRVERSFPGWSRNRRRRPTRRRAGRCVGACPPSGLVGGGSAASPTPRSPPNTRPGVLRGAAPPRRLSATGRRLEDAALAHRDAVSLAPPLAVKLSAVGLWTPAPKRPTGGGTVVEWPWRAGRSRAGTPAGPANDR